jgi:hypothetical protein
VELASSFKDDVLRQKLAAIVRLKAETLARYQALLMPWLSAGNLTTKVKH